SKSDLTYWKELDKAVDGYAKENGFEYVIDQEPFLRNATGKPIIINYFYHSTITQSAKNNRL
ncbi:MAG TPA: radical SAM protein, partial [Candidatus Enteromonas pullicola]|nr:radical SAM protein [Candidatus Enteromonas pullicola]